MRIATISRSLVALALLGSVASTTPAQTLPSAWVRDLDWVVPPNAAAGTTQGNPAPDSRGNLVWHYERADGGPLGSASPWYAATPTPLVWDAAWFGGPGAWAAANDNGGIIRASLLEHILQPGFFTKPPISRWKNVTGQTFDVVVDGSLVVGWSGTSSTAANVDVDVVLAHRDAATGALTLLEARTLQKPTPTTALESLEFQVTHPPLTLRPGDELLLSARARASTSASRWINLYDRLCFLRLPVGASYCGPGVPNSSGLPSRMVAHGSTHVADNDLTLKALQLPFNTFAFFVVSRAQGFVAQPAGSAGNLCLSGAIGRYVGPGQIVDTSVHRVASLQLDLAHVPTAAGFAQVQPGETWYFQCWHRDAGSTSNFSDGLAVLFD